MYQQLLEMAVQQPQQQRVLFLFAQAEGNNPKKSKKNQRGVLTPIMCVDKLPSELGDFESLVAEADTVSKNWDFVFVACLSGTTEKAPTAKEAEPFLNKMTNDLVSGNNIQKYVIFDRNENPIEMMAG